MALLFSGIILSIFLSFRNNASYERWWEGRKLWGTLIATSRHISRDSIRIARSAASSLDVSGDAVVSNLLRNRLRNQNQPIDFYQNKVNLTPADYDALFPHINAAQVYFRKHSKRVSPRT